ncbi:Exonuclease 3'-5' domain-containing protein 2 isoform X2 [Oopsacas minuta]|uniref:Exonuclease 3'-5' domain-containing protein 2 isoform X2 n=1 Tax=Oopsacas minuta TaxID=111878 RepID=A0AAV7K1Q0_9METZ|nr:Exonuclease 3'-5' domain-containing protein 2 isoform X2 [Oopsacas minuta]
MTRFCQQNYIHLVSQQQQHFPIDHKSYKSHDNLLLCGSCHLITSLNEDILKLRISKEYDAPIDSGASKLNSDPILYKVKNAARALAQSKNPLPDERAIQYREILKDFYQVEELDEEQIREAAKIDPKNENPNYHGHGEKVVEQVMANGELLEFQMRWRQHFLETMKPKFLPELWSATHNPNKDKYF